MSKTKDPSTIMEQKKNNLFWRIMSIFAIFIIGFLTGGLVLYEGYTLRRIKAENRAQLRKEREKRKISSEDQNQTNTTEEKMVLSKVKPNILEVLRN